jgi:hypothetical protein
MVLDQPCILIMTTEAAELPHCGTLSDGLHVKSPQKEA